MFIFLDNGRMQKRMFQSTDLRTQLWPIPVRLPAWSQRQLFRLQKNSSFALQQRFHLGKLPRTSSQYDDHTTRQLSTLMDKLVSNINFFISFQILFFFI
jgi:hypothetical protein